MNPHNRPAAGTSLEPHPPGTDDNPGPSGLPHQAGSAGSAGGTAASDEPVSPAARRINPWLYTLVSNLWVVAVIAAMVPLGWWVENPDAFNSLWARILILAGLNITLSVSLQLINGIAGQFSLGHAAFMAVGAYVAGYATLTHGRILNDPYGDPLDWTNPLGVIVYLSALALVVALLSGAAIAVWRLVSLARRLHPRLPQIIVAVVALWVIADLVTLETNLGATWLRLQAASGVGAAFSRVMTFGHGETALWLAQTLPAWSLKPIIFLAAIVGGGAMAAFAGLVIGLPTLRLRGDYLAIATLGFAQIIAVAIYNTPELGGATGLAGIPAYSATADPELGIASAYSFAWVYGLALVTIVAVWRLQHSPIGRSLQCVREDELAAAAVGINTAGAKVVAFVIGAALAGMAGAVFAHTEQYLNVAQFDFQRSVELVVMVTLGGLGSVPGAVVAAVLLTFIEPVLQSLGNWLPAGSPAWLTTAGEKINQYRLVIFALVLIIAMIVRGQRRGKAQ